MSFSYSELELLLSGYRDFEVDIKSEKMLDSIIADIFKIYQTYMLWSYEEFESAVAFITNCYEEKQTYLNTTHKGIFERMKEHTSKRGMSFGERLVKSVLDKEGFDYKQECYIGASLLEGQSIKLDFVIFYNDILYVIEYNGVQHYEPVEKFGGIAQFEIQKENDKKKKEFCDKYNIPLLEIPYTVRDEETVREQIKNFIKEK